MSEGHQSVTDRKQVVAQVVETMTMGGAENLAVRIANALPDKGIESHLIVITDPDVLSERISSRVHVHYLRFHRSSIKNPLGFLFSLVSGFRQLRGIVKSNGIQIVQTHLPGANFWGLLLTITGVCQVFTTIHNNQEFNYGDVDSRWRQSLRLWAYRTMVRKCRGTVAVSESVKHSLARDLDLDGQAIGRVSVVTNGVAIPESLSPEERAAIRLELGLDLEIPFVLAAGRFGPQKNFGDLLEIAAEMKKTSCNFQLVIAGEGDELETLRTLTHDLGIGEIVHLPGNLKNLNQVMLAADVFVMTSLWEGLPLVLLEAMAASLPVVAYAIDGVTELVLDDRTGSLVPPGEKVPFAMKLKDLLEDDDNRRMRGAAGRDLVTRNFNFSNLVERLVTVYSANP